MKKLFFVAACVAVFLTSCGKPEVKPFDVRDYDSVTVEDGAGNPVRLSISFLLDSTYNDLIKSEDELNHFFNRIVNNLKNECKYPRTFKPTGIISLKIIDTIEYNGVNIYVFQSLVDGIASNAFGVEGDISDILELIAWREPHNMKTEEGEVIETFALWHIMEYDDFILKHYKEDIDRYIAEQQNL